mmetsp:Transcript_12875/g.37954  ORF Transcript_12875/g.37954 Transcript_12875/m.37954 type:complete len:220 (-) Transcript_12875:75-734(-)
MVCENSTRRRTQLVVMRSWARSHGPRQAECLRPARPRRGGRLLAPRPEQLLKLRQSGRAQAVPRRKGLRGVIRRRLARRLLLPGGFGRGVPRVHARPLRRIPLHWHARGRALLRGQSSAAEEGDVTGGPREAWHLPAAALGETAILLPRRQIAQQPRLAGEVSADFTLTHRAAVLALAEAVLAVDHTHHLGAGRLLRAIRLRGVETKPGLRWRRRRRHR